MKTYLAIVYNSQIYKQKVLLIMGRVNKYTEVITLKISKQQKETLSKLKSKQIRVSDFIRNAIKEKIEREKHGILKPKKEYCPFSSGTIEINNYKI